MMTALKDRETIDPAARIDVIVEAFDGLNTALWEREDVNELEEFIEFLERELKIARKSVELMRGLGA